MPRSNGLVIASINEDSGMYRLLGALAAVTLAVAPLHVAGAQAAPSSAFDRSPRFLFAAGARSVELDVNRTPVLRRRITLNLDGATVREALRTISAKAGLYLTYSKDVIPLDGVVHLRAGNITVAAALTDVLLGAGADVVLSSADHASLVKRPSGVAPPPVGIIAGAVSDMATLQPIVGAQLLLDDTARATTNTGGVFTIRDVAAGAHQLAVRVLGYRPTLSSIAVRSGETTHVTIRMQVARVTLERVQVTATKSPLSVGEVPALTNAISNEQIAREGDVKFTQTLTTVPGLINSALEGVFESVQLRGMPRGDNEWTTTLLLIDGVPQTDSRNSARVINLPINDVGNIEVVRGPNSALYGSTAIGGVVNVLTAEPTSEPTVDFEVQGGSFDTFRAKGVASGPVGDWGGYYLSAAGGQNHGFYQQPFTFHAKDEDLYGKFTFSPDSKSQGMISVNDVVSDNAVPAPLPVIDGKVLSTFDPRVNLFANFNLPSANYHQEELRTTFSYQRKLTDRLNVAELFGFRRTQYRFENDGDVIGAPFDTVNHTFTQYPFEEEDDENHYYEDARFSITPDLGRIQNTLLVGASYDYHTGNVAGNLIYTDTSTFGWPLSYLNPAAPDRSTWQYFPFGGDVYHVGTLGLYAQYIIAPVSRLLFVLGGRYDKAHLENTNATQPNKPNVTSSYDAFSPKVSATFKVLNADPAAGDSVLHLNVYATYSGAFLPPRNASSLTPNDTISLQTEHIHNYEFGVKGDLGAGRLSFDGGFFSMTRNGIVVDTRVGPFYYPSNAGQEKFRGVETSANWNVTSALSVYANAAFYHNRFGDFIIQSSSGDDTLSGKRLPISPDLIYNFGSRWQHASGIGLTVNVKHVGSAMLDQGNTLLLQPYTSTDASVFWAHGPLLMSLSAHNLFDQHYFTMGDISQGQDVDPAAPRQIIASVSTRFK